MTTYKHAMIQALAAACRVSAAHTTLHTYSTNQLKPAQMQLTHFVCNKQPRSPQPALVFFRLCTNRCVCVRACVCVCARVQTRVVARIESVEMDSCGKLSRALLDCFGSSHLDVKNGS